MISSRVFRYETQINSLGRADGTVTLERPIYSTYGGVFRIRVMQIEMSSYIPNVFTEGTFTNAVIDVSDDGGATWSHVALGNIVTTITHIAAAINSACAAWWTDVNDPGFIMGTNSDTDITYLIMDSTKCAVPGAQLAINFAPVIAGNTSLAYELLGFVTVKQFIADGTYAGSHYPNMDWFGNSVKVILDGCGTLGTGNEKDDQELCSVPLSTANVLNEYVYPSSGIVVPWISCDVHGAWDKYSIRFVGSRANADGTERAILWTQGHVSVKFMIEYSPKRD